jgi:hypothetical protein
VPGRAAGAAHTPEGPAGGAFTPPAPSTLASLRLGGARQAIRAGGGADQAKLGRKAKIPLFKQFLGTDVITLPVYVGAMFAYHCNDHAGQSRRFEKRTGCLTPKAVARAGNHVQAKRRLAFRFFA